MAHKVFVGLSGGVDSAVSAALLCEQGLDVTGVFIKIWQPEFTECTWREDRLDAMRVAASLGIPFREIDLSELYKKEIVDAMVRDYAAGVTPNPDVLCNRHVKFGAFAKWAKAEGAESVATGHYARKRQMGGHTELLRAKDASKDQSYFLHLLDQTDLARALFPIGDMLKKDVRAAARRFELPVALKPDSQGLCFVGEVTLKDFLSRFITIAPGPVVEREGKRIGEHDGAALYTLGQRHGFRLRTPGGPYYVTGIDVAKNTVQVSKRREDAMEKSVTLGRMHWIYRAPDMPSKALVQARYHDTPTEARVEKRGEYVAVEFAEPRVASPGQSLVMYDGDVCLGGGIIMKDAPRVHSTYAALAGKVE